MEIQTISCSRFLLPSTREVVQDDLIAAGKLERLINANRSDTHAVAAVMREQSDAHRIASWPISLPMMHKIVDAAIPNGTYQVPIRVYYPQEIASQTATIFYVHGGGFMTSSIATDDGPVKCLAASTQSIVVQIDYRLAPEYPWPTGFHDVVAVAKFLLQEGSTWDIDGSKMVIMGESAGANLALNTLLELRDQEQNFLSGVLICGVYQPNLTTPSWHRYGHGGFLVSKTQAEFLLGCYLKTQEDFANSKIWPLYADLKGVPPLYLTMSSADPLRDDTLMLANKLQAVDQEYYLTEWVGLLHTGILEWGTNSVTTKYLELISDYISSL